VPRRRVVRRDVVLDHPYLHLRLDTERDAEGREHTYIWGTGPDIVLVVPVWPDGTVTLLSQRRYGLRARSVEVPGGHVDPGESPAAAAKRELREETGLSARRVTELLTFFPAIKLQQRFHAFLATGLRAGRAEPDDDEDVRTLRLPLAGRRGAVAHRLGRARADDRRAAGGGAGADEAGRVTRTKIPVT
jgi:ADP-ribose pyrophosphatase